MSSSTESSRLDQPGAVRAGEELDLEKLSKWLTENLPGGLSGPLEVEQFRKGYSNLTYLIRDGESAYVLRRPPFGSKVKTAHDMGREFRILSALQPVYAKAPKPLAYCEDESVLGAPFYLMQKVEGGDFATGNGSGGPALFRSNGRNCVLAGQQFCLIAWRRCSRGRIE